MDKNNENLNGIRKINEGVRNNIESLYANAENAVNPTEVKDTNNEINFIMVNPAEVKPTEITPTEVKPVEDKPTEEKPEVKTFQKIEDKIKKIKKDVISYFTISKKPIDANSYKSDGKKIVKRFSIFSTLDILNRNSDLFHYKKNSLNTTIKTIYSAEEINDLMDKTNSHSFDNFVSKVEKAMKHPTNGMYINNIAANVIKFITELKSGKEITFKDKNANSYVSSQLQKFENGPSALVSRVSSIYGDNRYYNKVNAYIGSLTPLFVKFNDEKEADDKILEVENYIKDTYNYTFKYKNKNKTNKLTRTIGVAQYQGKMDSCVNMLYNVAKNLKGSKNTSIKLARNLLNKNESNDFLTKKGWFNTYFLAKYTVVDKNQKVKKIFKAHSDTINDVVTTLTTAFMARFCFDSKYYAEVERDLTEQAANKMKYLSFSKDPNEDYWINQLIQERLKVNISQVCAANNITDAKELLEIYNNNGTVIVNPEKINCIDDLVFALQYSVNQKVKNKELSNLPEKKVKAKKQLKNKKQKVKKPTTQFKKNNTYLKSIRETDKYKQYYQQYLEEYKNVSVNFNDNKAKSELEDIKRNVEKNNDDLVKLANNGNLTEKDTETFISTAAANDAMGDIIKEVEERNAANVDEEIKEEETAEETNDATVEVKPLTENEEDKVNEENTNIDEIISDNIVQLSIDDIEIEESKPEETEEVTQLSLFDERFVKEAEERERAENERINALNALEKEIDQEKEMLNNEIKELDELNKKLEDDEKALSDEIEKLKNDAESNNEDAIKELKEEQENLAKERENFEIAKNVRKQELENEINKLEVEKERLSNETQNTNTIKKVPVFKTSKKLKNLTDEELKKKIVKYFYKTIHGANGKVGIVGGNLNYRIVDKKVTKSGSVNDSERLDDLQFKKANKLRDEKIDLIIEELADKTIEYFNKNKDNLPEEINIAKLCNGFMKSELNYPAEKSFTIRDVKNCLSVLITESVNPDLKALNLELYTGKKTYKNYQNNVANLIKGEE